MQPILKATIIDFQLSDRPIRYLNSNLSELCFTVEAANGKSYTFRSRDKGVCRFGGEYEHWLKSKIRLVTGHKGHFLPGVIGKEILIRPSDDGEGIVLVSRIGSGVWINLSGPQDSK